MAIEIRDHSDRLPALPIVQPPLVIGTARTPAPPPSGGPEVSGMLFIVAVAAGTGLAVLFGLLFWSRIKERGIMPAQTRRTSRN